MNKVMSMLTEAEILESQRQAQRRAGRLGLPPKKGNGTAAGMPSPFDPNIKIETGIEAAFKAKQAHAEGIKREVQPSTNGAASIVSGPTGNTVVVHGGADDGRGGTVDVTGSTESTGPTGNTGPQPRPSASLDFLDGFFGEDKRHLVAIKKPAVNRRRTVTPHHINPSY